MNEDQRVKCHAIIHTAAVTAAGVGAGLAQLPSSDNAVIAPIQVAMVVSLGAVFGVRLDQSAAQAKLATAMASLTGRAISQFLVGWLPLFGNALNATTAAAITESIGWAVTASFDRQEAQDLDEQGG